MSDWKTIKLADISLNNQGYYGIGAPSVPYSKKLYTYLRITDINDDGTINREGLKSVEDEKAHEYILQKNDIVFARTGASTGRSFFYEGFESELVYAGFLIKFSLDDNLVNPKFMKYYTQSNEYKGWVKSFNAGSTRGNINAKTYANMEIFLPPRKQQDFLVNILSALDDKIENNRRTAQTLEQIAQTIFKHWFIDFEFPNQQGQPYKASGGKMIWNQELGKEIPEGWKVGSISNLVEIISGGTPKTSVSEYWNGNIPWLSVKDFNNGNKRVYYSEKHITEKGLNNSATNILKRNDIIISARGTVGVIAQIGNDMAFNQSCYGLRAKGEIINTECLYYLIKHEIDRIKASVHGSVFDTITRDTFQNITIPIIPLEIQNQIVPLLSALNQKLENNDFISDYLTQLRDTLLPKLMSGEVVLL